MKLFPIPSRPLQLPNNKTIKLPNSPAFFWKVLIKSAQITRDISQTPISPSFFPPFLSAFSAREASAFSASHSPFSINHDPFSSSPLIRTAVQIQFHERKLFEPRFEPSAEPASSRHRLHRRRESPMPQLLAAGFKAWPKWVPPPIPPLSSTH